MTWFDNDPEDVSLASREYVHIEDGAYWMGRVLRCRESRHEDELALLCDWVVNAGLELIRVLRCSVDFRCCCAAHKVYMFPLIGHYDLIFVGRK